MNRYEFRIWDNHLTSIRREMERHARPSKMDESDEIYLISNATDHCIAKIRDELLDIKVLLRVERRLEQWSPILKEGFPIPASAIAKMFDYLKLAEPKLLKSAFQMKDFLDKASNAGILIVKTSKLRTHFKFDKCQTEFAQVNIDGIARETVAVESEDPDAVLATIARIGIADHENVSYVRNIDRLVRGASRI